MRKIIAFTLFLFIAHFSTAGNKWEFKISKKGVGEYTEYAFHVRGAKAFDLVDQLFILYPDKKRKGYIHKFKNFKAEGFDDLFSLKVQEGVHGVTSRGSLCFNTFTSERYKKLRMERTKKGDELGIIIYVKKANGEFIKSLEDAKLFEAHIRKLANVKS